ncbi:hypothetical protein [Marinobacter sediminicola]|uniref:hypothetical protein n=1 Tax=Marinobacter sediminicola TaxID=3072994 RepID=UPI0028124F6D|nr:hypothetical protein [Marinobacter sp. F26243]
MTEKTFQDLIEEEWDALEDYMSGEYSSRKRERWIEARDEAGAEFWRLAGGNRGQE